MKKICILILILIGSNNIKAREYHVSKMGNDSNSGSAASPLLTIQAAANIAQPGDVITVHEGIYREWINPPRGGISDSERIIYRAAEGEKAEIRGSEIIKGWENIVKGVWKVSLPNSFFGKYNPCKEIIRGDWFNNMGRIHHTGDVYLNGQSLWESAVFENVLNPKPQPDRSVAEGSTFTWYCESDKENTYIYANFHGADPNKELVEINVRKSCFYPDSTSINYITVSGFTMRHAATQWAPPTAEQIGLIGTNWSKGWIIENNIISDSRCSGITLGKHGDKFDNTSENSAEGYVETIHRAEKRGWSKENIGHHIVRNNEIYNCEQTGICGSLGAVFSTIENNTIYNIWTKRQFTGAEMGGIKIHASIDMVIRNNRLYNCGRGLWLDWMAQGTRVTGNLFFANTTDDIFMEVNHGPYLIDNNILLSDLSVRDWSEGGAWVHNLFAGRFELRPQSRFTPFHMPHSTELAGLKQTQCGDTRFYNNIFLNKTPDQKNDFSGLYAYRKTELSMYVDGNLYIDGATKFENEQNQLELTGALKYVISEDKKTVELDFNFNKTVNMLKTRLVTTKVLGKASVPGQYFGNRDGSSVTIDSDFSGKKRSMKMPTPGPFEKPENSSMILKIR